MINSKDNKAIVTDESGSTEQIIYDEDHIGQPEIFPEPGGDTSSKYHPETGAAKGGITETSNDDVSSEFLESED